MSERARGAKDGVLKRPPQPGLEAGATRNRPGAAFVFVAVFGQCKGWFFGRRRAKGFALGADNLLDCFLQPSVMPKNARSAWGHTQLMCDHDRRPLTCIKAPYRK